MKNKKYTRAERVNANNEWMRRYIEEPEKFEAQFRTVQIFCEHESAGAEPTYGAICERYLETLMDEARGKVVA